MQAHHGQLEAAFRQGLALPAKAPVLSMFQIRGRNMSRISQAFQQLQSYAKIPVKTIELYVRTGDEKILSQLQPIQQAGWSWEGTVLAGALGKVEAAGGKVAMPKTAISPEIGFMAFFIDSEGNRVGLHSNK